MKKVVIYTTPTCPHCRSAKEYLTSRNIPYIEKDITRDQSARNEMASMKVTGVPSFVINGELVIGFDRGRIEKLLFESIITCPACGSRLRLPAGKGKVRATCSKCSRKFEAEV